MISLKSQREIELMDIAGSIVARVHKKWLRSLSLASQLLN